MSNLDWGYLLRNDGKESESEAVRVKHLCLDQWLAWYEGKWRKVHIQVKRTYIVYKGSKITIHIDGV